MVDHIEAFMLLVLTKQPMSNAPTYQDVSNHFSDEGEMTREV
jgi:hypothetical protein